MQPEVRKKKDLSHIQGWGADLDPANRPAYPKERIPARDIGVHWNEVEYQEQKVRVFHSIERPGITPVFGTSTPPKGASGMIRQFAFKYSESDLRHWLLLLLADRLNVFEGLFEDLRKGHIPNIFKEMGWKAELKHNKRGFARKILVVTALIGGTVYLLSRRKARI